MDAVTVMGVDIHIGNPHTPVQEIMDSQGWVVENAEAGGVARRCVVQPAGNVECGADFPAGHHLSSQQRPSRAQSRRLEHVWVNRVVSLPAKAELGRVHSACAGPQRFDRSHIFRRVQPGKLFFGCCTRVQ